MVDALGDEGAYLVRGALPIQPSDNGKGVTLVAASPNLSEFEKFWMDVTRISHEIPKRKREQ
jgi:hypothetical protein